jgi:hypothetical protein
MKKSTLFIVVMGLLTACGPTLRWENQTSNGESVAHAELECKDKMNSVMASAANTSDKLYYGSRAYTNCMQLKGFERVPIESQQ